MDLRLPGESAHFIFSFISLTTLGWNTRRLAANFVKVWPTASFLYALRYRKDKKAGLQILLLGAADRARPLNSERKVQFEDEIFPEIGGLPFFLNCCFSIYDSLCNISPENVPLISWFPYMSQRILCEWSTGGRGNKEYKRPSLFIILCDGTPSWEFRM